MSYDIIFTLKKGVLMKKTALITGGSSDLASAISDILNDNNINIVLTYNNNYNKALKLYNELLIKNNNVTLVKCDVTNESDILNMIAIIKEKYGKLDYIINNAALSLDNEINDKTKEEFLRVLDTNVVGPFLIIKHATKIMSDGVVVNISSTDSFDTGNIYNIDYSASKSALNNLTLSLSKIYGNIKFIALAPNYIDTSSIREMNELFLKEEMKRINQKKLLTKEEVANRIYELLVDNNIETGCVIRMDDSDEK